MWLLTVFIYGLPILILWYLIRHILGPLLSPLRQIPGRPFRPFVGNMLEARKSEAMTNAIRWMRELNSKIVRFYFYGGEERLLIADPDGFRHILVKNSKNYIRPVTPGGLERLFGKSTLLTLGGPPHHNLRKMCNPGFSMQLLKTFVPVFWERAGALAKMWNKTIDEGGTGSDLPVQLNISALTLDVIGKCGFHYMLEGIEKPNSDRVQKFRNILNSIKASFRSLIPFYQFLPTAENQQFKKDFAYVKELAQDIMDEKRKEISRNVGSGDHIRKDLLSQLMLARNEEDSVLQDKELFGQVIEFLFAGFETTSIGMTWTLLQLAQYPEIQQKAREEILSVLPPTGDISVEHLDKLQYLTCVIKETLRLLPPVPVVFKKAIADDTLMGYHIPAGTKIGLHIGALHRLNWDDGDDFKPERFLTATETDSRKFMAFSFGPYMCIGHQFAMLEMKTVLSLLLREFQFSPTQGYSYRRVQGLVMRPDPPAMLFVQKVNKQ